MKATDFFDALDQLGPIKRLGLDFHGVIDKYPELSAATLFAPGDTEVYVVTGSKSTPEFIARLEQYKIIYKAILSITDYHESIGTTIKYDEKGNPWIDEELWNSAKALLCEQNDIDILIDDSEEYGRYFKGKTRYFLLKNDRVYIPRIKTEYHLKKFLPDSLTKLFIDIHIDNSLNPAAIENAKKLLTGLPPGFPIPEYCNDPDGSVSLDWYQARDQVFSLSVGIDDKLSYAWMNKGDKGHGVITFDGVSISTKLLNMIRSIYDYSEMDMVYVNMDTTLEDIVCVHTTPDGTCARCDKIRARQERYNPLEGAWFEIRTP